MAELCCRARPAMRPSPFSRPNLATVRRHSGKHFVLPWEHLSFHVKDRLNVTLDGCSSILFFKKLLDLLVFCALVTLINCTLDLSRQKTMSLCFDVTVQQMAFVLGLAFLHWSSMATHLGCRMSSLRQIIPAPLPISTMYASSCVSFLPFLLLNVKQHLLGGLSTFSVWFD